MPAVSNATGPCSATGDNSLIGLSLAFGPSAHSVGKTFLIGLSLALGVCRGRRKGRVAVGPATRATAVSIDGKRRREARDSWQGAELVCEMRTRRWLRCLMAVGGSGGGARGRPDDAAVHRRRAPVVSPVRGLKPRFALPPARLGLVRSPWPPPVGGVPSARTAARWVMRRAARRAQRPVGAESPHII